MAAFTYASTAAEIDTRLHFANYFGQKVVMRVLDRRNVTFNLDQLGVPPNSVDTNEIHAGAPAWIDPGSQARQAAARLPRSTRRSS